MHGAAEASSPWSVCARLSASLSHSALARHQRCVGPGELDTGNECAVPGRFCRLPVQIDEGRVFRDVAHCIGLSMYPFRYAERADGPFLQGHPQIAVLNSRLL